MNTIRELSTTITRRNLFVMAAISLFVLAGLLVVLPTHAQSTTSTTTTNSSSQSGTGTATGQGPGHNCPNMRGATSSLSSSTGSAG